jgi:hypothetical protein
MVFHVVLFRLRPEQPPAERQALAETLQRALESIPSIRRASVGRRVASGRDYERAMTENMEYAAVLEFDDQAGLQAYLTDQELGARFNASVAAAYVYDYEMTAGGELNQALAGW